MTSKISFFINLTFCIFWEKVLYIFDKKISWNIYSICTTCQTQIPANIIIPENKENAAFNERPKYEQVSISKGLLNAIEILEKIKSNKSKSINVNNIIPKLIHYNENKKK